MTIKRRLTAQYELNGEALDGLSASGIALSARLQPHCATRPVSPGDLVTEGGFHRPFSASGLGA